MTAMRAVILAVLSSLALAACSAADRSAAASSNPNLGIHTNQLYVTIEDKAGTPLSDVDVEILAAGALSYRRLISRIESGEKREISLSDFSSRDGTTFNLRMITPRSVKVSASDLTGKKYTAEVPWQQ